MAKTPLKCQPGFSEPRNRTYCSGMITGHICRDWSGTRMYLFQSFSHEAACSNEKGRPRELNP
jgi:hypothetical protein